MGYPYPTGTYAAQPLSQRTWQKWGRKIVRGRSRKSAKRLCLQCMTGKPH